MSHRMKNKFFFVVFGPVFCSSFLPVRRIFSALTTATRNPPSKCGVKLGWCFPRNIVAIRDAKRPRIWPSASARCHLTWKSSSLGKKVFVWSIFYFPVTWDVFSIIYSKLNLPNMIRTRQARMISFLLKFCQDFHRLVYGLHANLQSWLSKLSMLRF